MQGLEKERAAGFRIAAKTLAESGLASCCVMVPVKSVLLARRVFQAGRQGGRFVLKKDFHTRLRQTVWGGNLAWRAANDRQTRIQKG